MPKAPAATTKSEAIAKQLLDWLRAGADATHGSDKPYIWDIGCDDDPRSVGIDGEVDLVKLVDRVLALARER
jgi:hypothetical protein